jgi:hypothetical protein
VQRGLVPLALQESSVTLLKDTRPGRVSMPLLDAFGEDTTHRTVSGHCSRGDRRLYSVALIDFASHHFARVHRDGPAASDRVIEINQAEARRRSVASASTKTSTARACR